MYGRRAKAPCGHPGEHVIGQYVRCLLKHCDGTPGKKCPRCGSSRIKQFIAYGMPDDTMHCEEHGHVFSGGVNAENGGG